LEAASVLLIKCKKCKKENSYSPERSLKCGYCGGPLSLEPIRAPPSVWARLKGLFIRHPSAPIEPAGSNIRSKLDRLANAAWGTREEIAHKAFLLDPSDLRGLSHEAMVTRLLAHTRDIAPRLNVPRLTPRVAIEPLVSAAGQFVEQDGWVSIAVATNFFRDESAALAILCHELCHYVLNASGIREQPTEENERLTDAAMFVFGLGGIFLSGYRRAPSGEYRPGHRLGYLSDAEYRYADRYVEHLRASSERFASNEEEAMRRLQAAVHDRGARERLLTANRKKYPSKSQAEIIEAILDDLAKDNR
jgi:hypothetical protein